MAYTRRMYPKGSWALKALIGVLVIVLVTSVLYPRSLWNRYDRLIEDSRERMDNVNNVVNRFHEVHEEYLADLDSLLRFMDQDSVQLERAAFQFERLSLYDANYDSFLVGFTDPSPISHFAAIHMEPYRDGEPLESYQGSPEMKLRDAKEDPSTVLPDSVVMVMEPLEAFADVVEPVRAYITSPRGIRYYERDKGEEDIFWMLWSRGKVEREYLPYTSEPVPSQDYLLFRDLAVIGTDPISEQPYELIKNKRISLEGEYSFIVAGDDPDSSLAGSELALNLFINQLARNARSNLERQMNRDLEAGDSTLYNDQLQFQSEYFDVELEKLLNARRGRSIEVEGTKELMVPADSVEHYRNPFRIKVELFSVKYDSLIRVWTELEKTQQLVETMTWTEKFEVASEKIVGITVRPPFEGEYKMKSGNVLDFIFGVGPIDHPGYIENNDLSWSEKR